MGTGKASGVTAGKPTIVVAGDVCIDWLAVPVAAQPVMGVGSAVMNWKIRQGHHMFAVRGGAWLTADFVRKAIGSRMTVQGPQDLAELEVVPPAEVIHSMAWLRRRVDDKKGTWVVDRFEGFAGPLGKGLPARAIGVPVDDVDAKVVVLDDAGNGFRQHGEALWPKAVGKNASGLILLKVRSPLTSGRLWRHLRKAAPDRTIVLLSADDLRLEGANISKKLSWERTATDIAMCLARDRQFAPLREVAYCVVTLGMEGAVLLKGGKSPGEMTHLWYAPDLAEGQTLAEGRGQMSGFGSIFTASVAAELAQRPRLEDGITKGIRRGLESMRRLLDLGFGPVAPRTPPNFQLNAIRPANGRSAASKTKVAMEDVELPEVPKPSNEEDGPEYRAWRILDSKSPKTKWELAKSVVFEGLDKVLAGLPIGRFKKLEVIDRSEIESYRSVRNLIREFLRQPKVERPLSLAVFGPPGSGKSFGVKEVARSVDQKDSDGKDDIIEMIEFNLSQWEEPHHLVQSLHRVRDIGLRGKVPLVFFDEFDSRLGEQSLGWLKYFLAPMQDGVFSDGISTHQIGRAIFVFAGGTARTFAEFEAKQRRTTTATPLGAGGQPAKRAELPDPDQQARDAKLPDFLSRLRGHVDVFGFSPPCDTNLIRRAVVLRSNLLKKCPALKQTDGPLRIDARVVRAFLQVPDYHHGARSLEAILDMCALAGCTHLDPSHLPPRQQLELHVDGRAFLTLLSQHTEIEEHREKLAEAVHENYLERELEKPRKKGSKDSLKPWKDLADLLKTSNYEQVSFYPTLVAAAGCNIAEGAPAKEFEFSKDEIERLARLEHDRWMEERRIKQPGHRDLTAWRNLREEEKDKDRGVIAELSGVLAKAGLSVVRAT